MRHALSLLCLTLMLGLTVPAQAQHRADVPARHAPVRLFDQGAPAFSLNKLFSPEHFRMGHSYEMSFSSFGGGSSLGMYTNSLMWQFNQKLAARVDVAFAHSPFGNAFGSALGNDQNGLASGRLFLRTAEIAYRPNEHTRLHFSVRQSPYGSYMGPYGYGNGYGAPYYGHGSFYGARVSSGDELFWNDGHGADR